MSRHSTAATEPNWLRELGDAALRVAHRESRFRIALDEIAHRDGLTVEAMRRIAEHALQTAAQPAAGVAPGGLREG